MLKFFELSEKIKTRFERVGENGIARNFLWLILVFLGIANFKKLFQRSLKTIYYFYTHARMSNYNSGFFVAWFEVDKFTENPQLI